MCFSDRSRFVLMAIFVISAILALSGCDDRNNSTLAPATVSTDPMVFDDDFVPALRYDAFLDTYYEALDIDAATFYEGYASLVLTVRGVPSWSGGAFSMPTARDLTGFNALTCWSKSSEPTSFNELGFGIDVAGTAYNQAAIYDVPLDETWRKVIIPIPNADRLSLETGLFYFSDSDDTPDSIRVWFDEVQYQSVSGLELIGGSMADSLDVTLETYIGLPIDVNMQSVFTLDGDTLKVGHGAAYFDFAYSDSNVVGYSAGKLRAIGAGSTTVTAKINSLEVAGSVTVTVGVSPLTPAPTPTLPASDVIPFFSDAYTVDIPINWNTYWGGTTTQTTDMTIQGDNVKVYSKLNWVGIEFKNPTVDISEMTHFHMDVWVPEGTAFKIKLVDFGDDGTIRGLADDESELVIDDQFTPPFTTGEWISLDIPMTQFALATTEHLAQMILSDDEQLNIIADTIFVDNVYFHK